MNTDFNGMIRTHSAIFFESSIQDELEFAENNTRPPLVMFILVSNSGGATQNIKPSWFSNSQILEGYKIYQKLPSDIKYT